MKRSKPNQKKPLDFSKRSLRKLTDKEAQKVGGGFADQVEGDGLVTTTRITISG